MKRRDILKGVAIVAGISAASASKEAFSGTKSIPENIGKRSRVLEALARSRNYTVLSDYRVRGPGWVTFLWDSEHEYFVSETWDGHVGYLWMLVLIDGDIVQIPAQFAPVNHG